MSKQFINELSRMKDLFGYKKGQVISEQDFKPFDPNDSYPSLGIGGGNKSKLTPKQIEASDAGWGPVSDEFAKTLKVGPDGKILPKPVKGSTKEEYPECIKDFGNPTASKSGKEFSINGKGDWADYFFFPNGFYGSHKITGRRAPHGKYSCKGKIISIEPLDDEIIPIVKPKVVIEKPKELKNVKEFQDCMDRLHSGWYKGSNLNKGPGYGKFGPNTSKAWGKYKKDYLTGACSKFNRGGLGVPTEDGGETLFPTYDNDKG